MSYDEEEYTDELGPEEEDTSAGAMHEPPEYEGELDWPEDEHLLY